MAETTSDKVPPALAELIGERDAGELPGDALVRYEYIGLGPGIGNNHRFVLHRDGRLYASGNTAGVPSEPGERFNTPLPDEATAVVEDEKVREVASLLETELFSLPRYVGDEAVRGGAVVVVTARRPGDGAVHEVWFRNAHRDLTDVLSGVYHDATAEELDLDALLADLQRTEEDQ